MSSVVGGNSEVLLENISKNIGTALGVATSVSGIEEKDANVGVFPKLKSLIETVRASGLSLVKASDGEARSVLVDFQKYAERTIQIMLSNGELAGSAGCIHTKIPSTPLRTKDDEQAKEIVSESVAKDVQLLATVTNRRAVLRDYIRSGGVLVCAYSETQFEDFKSKNQETGERFYRSFVGQSGGLLIDKPLAIADLDDQYSGATYLVQDKQGGQHMFSLMAYQAHDTKDQRQWGLWCGQVKDVSKVGVGTEMVKAGNVAARKDKICDFLKENGVDLEALLAQNVVKRQQKVMSVA